MLREETIRIVKTTSPVVARHAEAITRRFYTLMFAGHPETLAYFNPAHQHSGGQQRALAGAICAYAANIDNIAALGPAVELIAQKHCSLGIRPEHYPIVGMYLLAAIQDILGEAATVEVLGAWREAYGLLADVFIERERQIYHAQAAVPGGWNGYRPFVVARKVRECDVVASFYLRPADERPLAAFVPGQYITVKVKDAAVAATPRNYSLSDRPGLDYYRISVKREPSLVADAPAGRVSNYLHDMVREGEALEIGPPCGEFTLDPERVAERPIVLLAGGIGITPLMAMLKSLAYRRVRTPVFFIHAARNSQQHALAKEARQAAAELPNATIHFRYDEPLEGDLRERRCDSAGRIDAGLLSELLPTIDCDYFVCGPKPFMAGLLNTLDQIGVADARIRYEFFGPKQQLDASRSAA